MTICEDGGAPRRDIKALDGGREGLKVDEKLQVMGGN